MGERLAFGTLVKEGFPVRLSGQDCERGTFSQRHAVLIDQETERRYTPLKNISPRSGPLRGHQLDALRRGGARLRVRLLAGRAEGARHVGGQFGDFANGAQVVIDQFISSGERKWLRMSGLVCCCRTATRARARSTPPRASSASCSCAPRTTWQVANCTTPANYFHILRRQLHRNFRKPLILMTPKSLLRHKRVVSRLDEFGPGTTLPPRAVGRRRVAQGEKIKLKPDKEIRRVVLCTGKVYYDLYEGARGRRQRRRLSAACRAALSVPGKALIAGAGRFPNAGIVWCQEEPKNMGAWTFIEPNIEWVLEHIAGKTRRARYAGRAASASHGDRPAEQAQAGAEGARGRRAHDLMAAGGSLAVR